MFKNYFEQFHADAYSHSDNDCKEQNNDLNNN